MKCIMTIAGYPTIFNKVQCFSLEGILFYSKDTMPGDGRKLELYRIFYLNSYLVK